MRSKFNVGERVAWVQEGTYLDVREGEITEIEKTSSQTALRPDECLENEQSTALRPDEHLENEQSTTALRPDEHLENEQSTALRPDECLEKTDDDTEYFLYTIENILDTFKVREWKLFESKDKLMRTLFANEKCE